MSDKQADLASAAREAALRIVTDFEYRHTRTLGGALIPDEGAPSYSLKSVLQMLEASWAQSQANPASAAREYAFCGANAVHGDEHVCRFNAFVAGVSWAQSQANPNALADECDGDDSRFSEAAKAAALAYSNPRSRWHFMHGYDAALRAQSAAPVPLSAPTDAERECVARALAAEELRSRWAAPPATDNQINAAVDKDWRDWLDDVDIALTAFIAARGKGESK